MRSGRVKSSTAAPSFRNSGLETTEKGGAALRKRTSNSAWMVAVTLSAVPTGTVDLSTTTLLSVMWRPMLRAAASTYCRSALPSSSGGVPTAMNYTLPCATLAATSVEKVRRPASTFRSITSFRPGS